MTRLYFCAPVGVRYGVRYWNRQSHLSLRREYRLKREKHREALAGAQFSPGREGDYRGCAHRTETKTGASAA